MKSEFNEMILIAEKSKKKGGSLGATFKLIQDLTEFEQKIQDCIDAQEIHENKESIESFLSDIDKMYKILLRMSRRGIKNLRGQRNDNVLAEPEEGVEDEGEETVDVEIDSDPEDIVELADKRKTPVMLNVPQVPKM